MEWRSLGAARYLYKTVLHSLNGFTRDLSTWNIFGSVMHENIWACPEGGCFSCLLSKDQVKEFALYSATGNCLVRTTWGYTNPIFGYWMNNFTFVCVLADGGIRLFTVKDWKNPVLLDTVQRFVLARRSQGDFSVSSAHGHKEWIVVVVSSSIVVWYNVVSCTITQAVLEVDAHAAITDIKLVYRSVPYACAVMSDGTIYYVGFKHSCQLSLTTPSADSKLKFTRIAFSQNQKFLACLTEDSFIALVVSESLTKLVAREKSIVLPAKLVSSPVLLTKQFHWLGNHAIVLCVEAPTKANFNQHCLFVGGPGGKWFDIMVPSWAHIYGSSTVKIISQDALSTLQFASTDILQVHGPGSNALSGIVYFTTQNSGGDTIEQEITVDSSVEYISNDLRIVSSEGISVPSSNTIDGGGYCDENCKASDRSLNAFEAHLKCIRLNNTGMIASFGRLVETGALLSVPSAVNFKISDALSGMSNEDLCEAFDQLHNSALVEYDLDILACCVSSCAHILVTLKQNGIPNIRNYRFKYYMLVRNLMILSRVKSYLILSISAVSELRLRRIITFLLDIKQYKIADEIVNVIRLPGSQLSMDHCKSALDLYNSHLKIYTAMIQSSMLIRDIDSGASIKLDSQTCINVVRNVLWHCVQTQKHDLVKALVGYERNPIVYIYICRLLNDNESILRTSISMSYVDGIDYLIGHLCPALFFYAHPRDNNVINKTKKNAKQLVQWVYEYSAVKGYNPSRLLSYIYYVPYGSVFTPILTGSGTPAKASTYPMSLFDLGPCNMIHWLNYLLSVIIINLRSQKEVLSGGTTSKRSELSLGFLPKTMFSSKVTDEPSPRTARQASAMAIVTACQEVPHDSREFVIGKTLAGSLDFAANLENEIAKLNIPESSQIIGPTSIHTLRNLYRLLLGNNRGVDLIASYVKHVSLPEPIVALSYLEFACKRGWWIIVEAILLRVIRLKANKNNMYLEKILKGNVGVTDRLIIKSKGNALTRMFKPQATHDQSVLTILFNDYVHEPYFSSPHKMQDNEIYIPKFVMTAVMDDCLYVSTLISMLYKHLRLDFAIYLLPYCESKDLRTRWGALLGIGGASDTEKFVNMLIDLGNRYSTETISCGLNVEITTVKKNIRSIMTRIFSQSQSANAA